MAKVYSVEEAMKELGKDIDQLTSEIQAKAREGVQILAGQAHAFIVDKANTQLKSTREIYIDALDIKRIESSPNQEIWSVTLDKSAKWIEDGQPRHEMLDYLTKGPKAKTAKDGHKYTVIPFKHNKPQNKNSLAQQKLANFVKNELEKRGLDKTITRDGRPVLGRAATLNLSGKGAPTSKFNKPLLHGLTIYQREVKTQEGKTQIKRDVMTFRVASDKQKGSGLWEHPGRQAMNFFELAAKEIDVLWERMIKDIVGRV